MSLQSFNSLASSAARPDPLPNTGSSHSNLPVILCLHGGGTNAVIFNIQTIRLQRALASHFEFAFLDAPVGAPPGPGVLPFFEGCGPFYRWGNHGSPDLSPDTQKRIAERISEVQEGRGEYEKKGKRKVVGILGFSQGGRCAAGLVLEQQLSIPSPIQTLAFEGFKFGIFLNSTSPPLLSANLSEEQRVGKVMLPAVHVIGTEDPWRDEGFKLWKGHFSGETSCLIELGIGHRLPVKDEDTLRIAKEVLRVWDEVRKSEDAFTG